MTTPPEQAHEDAAPALRATINAIDKISDWSGRVDGLAYRADDPRRHL